MKKFLLVSLLCTLAVPTLAKTENLTLEQRIEKLEKIIEELYKELKKQKLNIKKNEKKLSLATKEKPKNDDTELQFNGYLRTGAEGNMKHGNKSSYSKFKEYVGRWGNEYDTNFNINFSKKFIQNNGAWTKLAVQLESWSDNYDNTVGDESKVDLTQLYVEMGNVPMFKGAFKDAVLVAGKKKWDDQQVEDNTVGDESKVDLTQLYVEMGNVPMFKGAFKDAVLVAGKKKWDDQQVEILDYYYQEVAGTGLGIEKIKLWDGDLSLAYITNDFKDSEIAERDKKNRDVAEDIRAYKAKYTYKDLSGEIMYAHAMDNDNVKEVTNNDNYNEATVTKREATNDGIYAGLYYQPNNFFGLEGKGQHYLQYSTGLLAGEGIGKIDTDFNKRAADDAVTYQLGLGGTVRLGDRTHMLVSYRSLRAENIEARKYDSYPYSYPDGQGGTIYDRTEFQNSWRY